MLKNQNISVISDYRFQTVRKSYLPLIAKLFLIRGKPMYLKTAQNSKAGVKYDPVSTPLVQWEGATLEMNQQEPGFQSTSR